jgi:hypothetical protein
MFYGFWTSPSKEGLLFLFVPSPFIKVLDFQKVGFAFGNPSAPVELQVFLDYCVSLLWFLHLTLGCSLAPSSARIRRRHT